MLIGWGVHAKGPKSSQAAVTQMAADCGNKLALAIMTHRHADHIAGFGTCSNIFGQINVDRVWMPWFENPDDKVAAKIQQNLAAMATQLASRLAARGGPESDPYVAMVDNITGGLAAAGGTGNQKALDVLAARAQAADKTLNNQSLVILFSFKGKNLLFAGDAQWGNWENFLYGGAFGTPGHTQMTKQATEILNNIDFYKVGHHGSRNATPKDAVAAMMRAGCVCMCSTQLHAYNEVPREPLMQALRDRMAGQLARSDQVSVNNVKPEATAGALGLHQR